MSKDQKMSKDKKKAPNPNPNKKVSAYQSDKGSSSAVITPITKKAK